MFLFAINTHWQTHFLFGTKTAITQFSVFLCQQLRIWIRSEFWFCVREIMLQELQNMYSFEASLAETKRNFNNKLKQIKDRKYVPKG